MILPPMETSSFMRFRMMHSIVFAEGVDLDMHSFSIHSWGCKIVM